MIIEPATSDILHLLLDIQYDWHKIGHGLRVRDGVLNGLIYSNMDDNTKMSLIIDEWKKTQTTPVIWESVIKAVEYAEHNRTAVNIRQFLSANY